MLKKDEAVCIRAADYSETSQIVTVFTRSGGKIRAIAKGSKRAKSNFGGAIELFASGQIVFSESRGAGLATLTEFEHRPVFSAVPGKLFALNCCLFAVELLDCFTEEYDAHPELFDSFIQFLRDSRDSQDRADMLRLLVVFQLTLLEQIGSGPVLTACVNCKTTYSKRWQAVYFGSEANGLICRDCEASFADKMKLSGRAAVCLTDLKLIGRANEKALEEIEKVLVYHFTRLLHRVPKMAKYVLTR